MCFLKQWILRVRLIFGDFGPFADMIKQSCEVEKLALGWVISEVLQMLRSHILLGWQVILQSCH